MKVILPKENANCNDNNHIIDYSSYKISLGEIDNYRICQRMGKGKYSDVFEGRCVSEEIYNFEKTSNDSKMYLPPPQKIVIKVLKPIRYEKVAREVLILRSLEHKNIILLKDVVYDKSSEMYSLIFDYIKHKDTNEIFQSASLNSIKIFAKQILEALKYAHSKGIFHRDIKPQNMIITDKRQLKIIDWGLAEFYWPNYRYSVRVASRYYKGPELLVEYPYYDYSLDIWSFGCVLAELIFKKFPFFHGSSNNDQMCKIIKFLGKKDLRLYLKKFNINYEIPDYGPEERISFKTFLNENQSIIFKDGIDLLDKILIYDHSERLTASQCLEHPFFTI